jgi:hypothetical protein
VIGVNLHEKSNLELEVSNLSGQIVYQRFFDAALPGMNKINVDVSGFSPGVYFYTINADGSSVTKKMIVE